MPVMRRQDVSKSVMSAILFYCEKAEYCQICYVYCIMPVVRRQEVAQSFMSAILHLL